MLERAGAMKTTRRDGFSLIELLLVIVVLGILSVIVVVTVRGITADAQTTGCDADRQQLQKAAESYFANEPAVALPAVGTVEPYEEGLVAAGFLRAPSAYYDLDADGQLSVPAGSPCTLP